MYSSLTGKFTMKAMASSISSKTLIVLLRPHTVNEKVTSFSDWNPKKYSKITLIGGGSGITPLFQILNKITELGEKDLQINLIYGNRSEVYYSQSRKTYFYGKNWII